MLGKLLLYLSFPFVRYAFAACVLISLSSALIGVILVLKRFSYIGDGLSHAAFGAMAAASAMRLANQMAAAFPVTILCAVLLLKNGETSRMRSDAAIAVISVTSLAFGYLLMNLFPSSGNISGDVCTTLFGSSSILTLSSGDVLVCCGLALGAVLLFVLFYNRIFSVTFDESFAAASGIDTSFWNMVIAISTAVIIVIAMNLVGSLLISALIIFPALAAMSLSGSFRKVILIAACFSVLFSVLGMVISILAETPVGSTIVLTEAAGFVFCRFWKMHRGD